MLGYVAKIACAVVLSGCGSLVAASGRAVLPTAEPNVVLSAVEGRPAGLVLSLQADLAAANRAELYRIVDDAEPTLLQGLSIDERTRRALSAGLEVVDSTVEPGSALTYQLILRRGESIIGTSLPVEVVWQSTPPRPVEVTADAMFEDVIELHWESTDGLGAVVFRRDVLAGATEFERVAEVPAGTVWVDRGVRPDGVWAYRVAFARRSVDLVQYGTPSEEVYASTEL